LVAQRGWEVTVLDRRPRLDANGPPIAPYLHPPTLEILDRLGLLPDIEQDAVRVVGATEYAADGTASEWRYTDVADCAFRYGLSVRLDDLSGAILRRIERMPNVRVLTGVEVTGLPEESPGIHGVAVRADGAEYVVSTRLIVASDGKFSAVRTMAGIPAEVFEFDRRILRTVVPRPQGWSDSWLVRRRPPSLLLALPVAGDRLAVLWIPPTEDHDRLRSGEVSQLVEELAAVEPALDAALRDSVRAWSSVHEVVHHIVTPVEWYRDNVVLHGDSAHGVHFYGGQGLNLALQDSLLLSDAVHRSLSSGDMGAVEQYVAQRRPFVERFQNIQKRMPGLTSAVNVVDHDFWGAEVLRTMALGQPGLRPACERAWEAHQRSA
jgi:2-polyprenyl-6-methoxyphenol hydroxylase and related FAD-dependent oxidoreductases